MGVILAVQALLSLRLIWSNTAFTDEGLYLWSGRLEWVHWLHGTRIPNFPSYFSGSPDVYPPLGAMANALGGLTAARLLSLCFMLGATALLHGITRRLFGLRPANFAPRRCSPGSAPPSSSGPSPPTTRWPSCCWPWPPG